MLRSHSSSVSSAKQLYLVHSCLRTSSSFRILLRFPLEWRALFKSKSMRPSLGITQRSLDDVHARGRDHFERESDQRACEYRKSQYNLETELKISQSRGQNGSASPAKDARCLGLQLLLVPVAKEKVHQWTTVGECFPLSICVNVLQKTPFHQRHFYSQPWQHTNST